MSRFISFEKPLTPEVGQSSFWHYVWIPIAVIGLPLFVLFLLFFSHDYLIRYYPVWTVIFYLSLSTYTFIKRVYFFKEINLFRKLDVWSSKHIITVPFLETENVELKFKSYQVYNGSDIYTDFLSVSAQTKDKAFLSKIQYFPNVKKYIEELISLLENNKVNLIYISYCSIKRLNKIINIPIGLVLNDKYFLPLNNSILNRSAYKNYLLANLSFLGLFGLIISLDTIFSYLGVNTYGFTNSKAFMMLGCFLYPLFSLVCFSIKTSFRNTIRIRGLNSSFSKEIPQWHPKK